MVKLMNKTLMNNLVASVLCNKDIDITCEECFSSAISGICKDSNKCRVAEKTVEQLKYILTSIDENVFLNACPGSGKTEVVGMKAAYEINNWHSSNRGGIAFLSFTNHAANVINERVDEFCIKKSNYPHFVGTFSSFIYGYISQPFGYTITDYSGEKGDFSLKLVDSNIQVYGSGWLNNYKCKLSRVNRDGRTIPIYSNQIEYDYSKKDYVVPVSQYKSVYFKDLYNTDSYQQYIKRIRERNNKSWLYKLDYCLKCFDNDKSKFLKDGFVNFEDMNQVAYNVLLSNEELSRLLSKRFPLIIIDECQDLSFTELKILYELKNTGTNIHFIGDLNQSLYEFRRVDPNYVSKFVECFRELNLSINFRSCKQIVEVIEKIIPSDKKIIAKGPDKLGDSSKLYIEYDEYDNILNTYQSIIDKCGIHNSETVVLVKQNSLRKKLNNISSNNDKHILLEAIEYWKTDNPEAKRIALNKCGKQISKWFLGSKNSFNYFCPNDIQSKFYWRIFLKSVLNDCLDCSISETEGIKYADWYKVVRENLPSIIQKRYDLIKEHDNQIRDFDKIFKGRWFNAKDAKQFISRTNIGSKDDFEIMTIHSSKGCTFDSCLIVSSIDGNSESGHWKKHWIDGEGEDCRVGYVALSRAKYQIVLAVPTLSEDDRNVIEQMGFKNYKQIYI